MQLPFKLEDVRFISIDGDVARFLLPNGFFEVALDSRKTRVESALPAVQSPTPSRINPKHIFFDDGIYGL